MKPSLFIILIISLIMSCQPKNDPPNENNSELLKTDHSEISFDLCGSGETTLLFVHGWNIDKSYWSTQQDVFCERYQIVTMDLPGFGDSKNLSEQYSIASYARDINDLIGHLGLKKVILIGHSMGGRIILEAAQGNDKVIALIGVDNFKEVQQKLNDALKAEADGFVDWLMSDFSNNSTVYVDEYLIYEGTDSLIRKRIVNNYRKSNPKTSIPAIQTYLNYPYAEEERLANLKVPLFLISSDMFPVDTVGLQNTGLEYRVFEMSKTGHFPMVEQPEVFNKRLGQALEQIELGISR